MEYSPRRRLAAQREGTFVALILGLFCLFLASSVSGTRQIHGATDLLLLGPLLKLHLPLSRCEICANEGAPTGARVSFLR